MTVNDSRFIHIVGSYKSGTSWLLHILAAHPSILAWREFDSVRAAYRETRFSQFRRAANLYRVIRNLPVDENVRGEFKCKNMDDVVRDVFCGSGWVPLMDGNLRQRAKALDYSDSGKFIDSLMLVAGKKLARDGRPLLESTRFNNTLGFGNSTRAALIAFLDAIKKSDDMSQVPIYFYEYLQRQCEPNALIAVKAADQIMCLEQLQQASPHSKKIAMIRDGRDAAISAAHYGKLMRERDAPWKPDRRSFLHSLRSWAVRTRVLSNEAKAAGVTILRYEDLKRDYFGICGALFTTLNIPTSRQDLMQIQEETDFSVVAGGRAPGDSAEHIVRKGITGEWKSVLTEKEANLAWRVAGPELERFGYSKCGEYRDAVPGLLEAKFTPG